MRARKNATKPEGRKTLAYVRVSTQDQAAESVSLGAQEARIATYCAAMGWAVTETVRDAGESAKSLKRPGVGSALDAVSRGLVERIVVAKLDRLTRSVRDLSDLIDLCSKQDVALVSVGETLDTSTAAGRMVVNMLGVVAAWEREAIAERTAAALAHKRRNARAYGPVAFGYRREGDALLPDAREQAALVEAQRMDREGASFREIGAMLAARDVAPHRGKRWHASSVRAVLRSRIATEAAATA